MPKRAKPAPPEGRDESFAASFRKHHDFVWRSLLALGVSDCMIDDALQEVFLVVHRRWSERAPEDKFRAWLYGIARRVCAGHRRRWTHWRARWQLWTEPAALDPMLALEYNEAGAWLERFIAQLSANQREVFVLAELEGASAREIAELTGVTSNTVSSRLRLARKNLDRKLAARHAANSGRRGNAPT